MIRLHPIAEITLDVAIVGDGTVNRFPEGSEVTASTFDYNDDEQVVLTARANENSVFIGWTIADGAGSSGLGSDGNSTNSVLTLKMHEAKSVVANFETVPGPVSAAVEITTDQNVESLGVEPVIQGEPQHLYSVTIESNPLNGQVRASNGLLFYKPDVDFVGSDSFTFQVENQFGQRLATPATGTVIVNAVNQAPESATLVIETQMNVASELTEPEIADSTEDETFTYRVLIPPSNGVVNIIDDGFIYTPVTGFVGEDSFLYQITDSADNTLSATATITVLSSTVVEPPEEPVENTNPDIVDETEDPIEDESNPPSNDDAGEESGGGGGGGALEPVRLFVFMMLLLFLRMRGLRRKLV